MGSDVSGNVYKKTHSVSVAGRLVYHVPIWRLLNTNIRVSQEHDEAISRVIDSYISTIVGYSFVSSKEVGNTEDQDSEGFLNGILGSDVFSDNGTAAGVPLNFVYQVSAGVKYHISEKWGIYGEIGYGTLGILNIGATYRIIPNKVK